MESVKDKETTFKLNQQVVYPLQGVGQIISIEERVFKSKPMLYYVIYLAVTDMTIMVPVDKAVELSGRGVTVIMISHSETTPPGVTDVAEVRDRRLVRP